MSENLIGVNEMSRMLSIPKNTLKELIETKSGIPFYKVGDDYKFSAREVLKWAKNEGSGKQ